MAQSYQLKIKFCGKFKTILFIDILICFTYNSHMNYILGFLVMVRSATRYVYSPDLCSLIMSQLTVLLFYERKINSFYTSNLYLRLIVPLVYQSAFDKKFLTCNHRDLSQNERQKPKVKSRINSYGCVGNTGRPYRQEAGCTEMQASFFLELSICCYSLQCFQIHLFM